jgi:hypothetical protein
VALRKKLGISEKSGLASVTTFRLYSCALADTAAEIATISTNQFPTAFLAEQIMEVPSSVAPLKSPASRPWELGSEFSR